jgi:hypothetical protein
MVRLTIRSPSAIQAPDDERVASEEWSMAALTLVPIRQHARGDVRVDASEAC